MCLQCLCFFVYVMLILMYHCMHLRCLCFFDCRVDVDNVQHFECVYFYET